MINKAPFIVFDWLYYYKEDDVQTVQAMTWIFIQKLQQEIAEMKDGRRSVYPLRLRLRNVVNKCEKQDKEIHDLRAMLLSSEDRIRVCVLEGEALKGKAAYYQKEISKLRGKLSRQDNKMKAAKYRMKQAFQVLSGQDINPSSGSSDILSVDDDAMSIVSTSDDEERSSSGHQSAAHIYRPPTPHPYSSSSFVTREHGAPSNILPVPEHPADPGRVTILEHRVKNLEQALLDFQGHLLRAATTFRVDCGTNEGRLDKH
ncbi:hypothetical protein CVT24_002752 [Panaeolus cyanescens]|uniref:Uncharacterized protein n=1 Tax=Panaeolus cyanescens TaxID=181874 RepID=A0A409XAN1_9AGAR|nr:hypothetical protein CVT24_002752 [Panaeolus cyanescens]